MAIQVDEKGGGGGRVHGRENSFRVHGPEVTANGLQVAKLLALCASLICPDSASCQSRSNLDVLI